MLGATVSLFVFTHEAVHVIRLDGPEMMCIGFGEGRTGFVEYQTIMTDSEVFKEEVIANVIALIIVCLFIYITTFLIINNLKGGS